MESRPNLTHAHGVRRRALSLSLTPFFSPEHLLISTLLNPHRSKCHLEDWGGTGFLVSPTGFGHHRKLIPVSRSQLPTANALSSTNDTACGALYFFAIDIISSFLAYICFRFKSGLVEIRHSNTPEAWCRTPKTLRNGGHGPSFQESRLGSNMAARKLSLSIGRWGSWRTGKPLKSQVRLAGCSWNIHQLTLRDRLGAAASR